MKTFIFGHLYTSQPNGTIQHHNIMFIKYTYYVHYVHGKCIK